MYTNEEYVIPQCGCEVANNSIKYCPKHQAASDMYEALRRILSFDDSGCLAAAAYSGGDMPKKWIREVAPAIEARSAARKEMQAIARQAISKAEEGL
uniref:Uncharacterized protein n=1 Tax=viral metagenome TaxID=1070528 RepID=A0A6M3LTT0_9ZZZZ